jgi:hypothetical protein
MFRSSTTACAPKCSTTSPCLSSCTEAARRLYFGRNTRSGVKLDFLSHFTARDYIATGHPYVAFVDVPNARQSEELRALIEAVEAGL